MTAGAEERERDLAVSLDRVRGRIESACAEHDRSPDEVTLVVVTKFFPASDVRILAGLGVAHVGENRHQEAQDKAAECAALDLTWHYVGGLQSNKAAAVADWADVVHSVDRAKLLSGLSRGAQERGRPLDVLLQVSLDPPGDDGSARGRAGLRPEDVAALAEATVAAEGLVLRGVMGVAPREGDPGEAFALLARAAATVRTIDPGATWLSAGMSGDLEQAVAHGATHVRVGSAVLGMRPARG